MVYVVSGNGFKTKSFELDGPVAGYCNTRPNSEGLERWEAPITSPAPALGRERPPPQPLELELIHTG
jgi:hypothetical protein